MNQLLVTLAGVLMLSPLFPADDCPSMLKTPEESKFLGEVRVKAIRGWDKLITWALTPKMHPYYLASPLVERAFTGSAGPLPDFVENYGYFSIHHPIVGIVTEEKRDIKVTNCLLAELSDTLSNPLQLQFSEDEILAKVMAYRPLQKGMHIDLPSAAYVVDEVLDLWKGMPAFGLIDKKKKAPPILLFRGTDLNLVSEKGWASIMSDLDTSGPGYSTFLRAQETIRSWLMKVKETPARLVGFSLGGVFVLYTMLHNHDLVSQEFLSVAYNPPGVSKDVLQKWEKLPIEQRPPHHTYVNRGDFVSQIGYFFSDVWEVTLPEPMGVIEAHVTLVSAKPEYALSQVDVSKENASRD